MIHSVELLETLLSEPSPRVIDAMGKLKGDLLLLGVGGKMGPTLARMAKRACDAAGVRKRIVGVSRFTSVRLPDVLRAQGIETIACDLLDESQWAGLPEMENVVVLTGMKFGSTGQEALTWAMNSYLPALVCRRFRRGKIVAFSTGNVYGLSPVHLGGSLETDPLQAIGEYSMSCVGRERIYEYFSRTLDIPVALLRLNYATELRYGVLVDIGQRVLAEQPIALGMGHVNALWQGDANAMALQAFEHLAAPPFVVNLAGPETLSVRRVAELFGLLLHRPVTFEGVEASEAFLSNGQLGQRLFGYPRIGVQQMILWIADWLQRGGETLGKPTHFETLDAKF